MTSITTLFFDIGGVVLTNAWDQDERRTLAGRFGFDFADFESRHLQVDEELERGGLSLHDYLQQTIFHQPRAFTEEALVQAIEAMSQPKEATFELLGRLRRVERLGLMTLNNEVRELNEYRIRTFSLKSFFSAFFTSCYLGLLKPHPEIYLRALDIAQRDPAECAFVDDRTGNVQAAAGAGMRAILFRDADQLEGELRAAGIEF